MAYALANKMKQRWRDVWLSFGLPETLIFEEPGWGRLQVTRAIGDVEYHHQGVTAEPEVGVTQLQPGDEFILMATDGEFVEQPGYSQLILVQ